MTLAYQPRKIKLQMHRILLNCLQRFYLIQTKKTVHCFRSVEDSSLGRILKKINILQSSIYNSTVNEKNEVPGSAVKKMQKTVRSGIY